ncbi:hypothetical protein IMSHALPRED_006272 [Imshaugia aleurites]|uniref:Uncharacterized protein n=1 Tax=Imshaugia aleurites TaxID=172621 RepID=A0A8H3FHP8_9LECA|nr:hypothetical protein IMSHALPRED_006272 [Imshaugia aleurites]
MQNQVSPSRYISPKRKRCDQDSLLTDAPSPTRLKTTDLPTRPLLEQGYSNEGSPRTNVVGHLQNLDLQEHSPVSRLDFALPVESNMSRSEPGLQSDGFNPNIILPSQTYNAPITPPPTSIGPLTTWAPSGIQDKASVTPLEIPETPRLRPVSSPTPPPSAKKSRSPPPPPLSPTLWWHDEEITGHNPNDPTDDGYGINGVGFLPTPAIANARAERRKKQVTEWKNREAREARQKRGDRRRRRELGSGPSGNSTNHGNTDVRANENRKVRFLEI